MNELAKRLCLAVRDRVDGVVEWKDGPKRRLFFYEGGGLVLVQSNLRSESPERVSDAVSSSDPETLRRAVLRTRMEAAFLEKGGEVGVTSGIQPPARTDVLDVIAFAMERPLPSLPPGYRPRAVASTSAWVAVMAVDPTLAAYLRAMDGDRPLEDVLDFGPVEPERVDRAMRFLAEVGGLQSATDDDGGYVVRLVSNKPKGASDEIASMIATELGGEPTKAKTTVDPLAVAFGPTLDRIRNATDHFGVLGVSWRDPPETIRRAYFTLAKDLHPDRFVNEPELVHKTAEELFDKVRAAWEMLGEETKREAYIAKVVRGEKTEDELAMEKVRAILDAEQLFKRALSEYHAGRLPQAHQLFQEAAGLVAEEAEFQAYAGFTTFKLNFGRDEKAADAGAERLFEAVKGNDKLDSGLVLVGLVHRARGDDAAAKKAFVQALRIKPSNPDAARELKRLEARPAAPAAPSNAAEPTPSGGFFSRLFKKK